MYNKLIYTFFILSFHLCALYAEPIRVNYYAHIEGLQDSALKSALHDSISGGIRYDYGTNKYHTTNNPPSWQKGDLKAYGTWQAFPLTDITEDGKVWDMYSRSVRYYPLVQGESGCSLNIEHSFPKAWWGKTENDAYKDLYHLNPSDARANQTGKSDYPPGIVDSIVKFDNGFFRQGYMKGHSSHRVYEPADEYKGDFARAYFYIVTAYEDYEWEEKYNAYLDNSSYLEFRPWLINLLLEWHRQDPVSEKEQHRQHIVSSIQHNRNPYIDYPELLEFIWGNRKGECVRLSELQCTEDTDYEPPQVTDFAYCPDELTGNNYDTIINVPCASLSALREVSHSTVTNCQSNGTAAVTMGSSSNDGEITFDELQLRDTAYLLLRTSPYNSATRMQLDVYADDQLIQSITENVVDETRNEQYHLITIMPDTRSIRIASVGGSTTSRACLQQLYLLVESPKTGFDTPSAEKRKVQKIIRNGRLYILSPEGLYTIQGTQID